MQAMLMQHSDDETVQYNSMSGTMTMLRRAKISLPMG
jgi:hypothetical protein